MKPSNFSQATSMIRTILTLSAALLLSSGTAFAHTGAGPVASLSSGLFHPIAGADHVLAMVAVGILAMQQGGRATWFLPFTFVAMMLAGGAVAMFGMALPLVEQGILGSVVILGAAIAVGQKIPWPVTAGLVGLFAVFHGHAHGAEIEPGIGGLGYAIGFATATALLHAAGAVLGAGAGAVNARLAPTLVRSGGAAIASGGMLLIAF